jgi:hypothetical protein
MRTKEVRPTLEPETCAVCGRRLLQGEDVTWYMAADAGRRPVCELCVPRAERARWMRVREGEEPVQLRPARGQRVGLARRFVDFFSAHEEDELERLEPAGDPRGDPSSRRRDRAGRRDQRLQREEGLPIPTPRDVQAIPVGTGSKLEQGLHLFNASQFPRTIAGLSRSLGDPHVAVINDTDSSVEVFVGWDIAWYSYRVDLGDATEPVEQSGRGNDTIELNDRVSDWNAFSDEYGRLYLTGEAIDADPTSDAPEVAAENSQPALETPPAPEHTELEEPAE